MGHSRVVFPARRAFAATCAALLVLGGFLSTSAAAAPVPGGAGVDTGKYKQPIKPAPMADQTIPGSPLSVTVRDSGSAALYYNGIGQFFSDNGEGVFIWLNGQVWGPSDVPFGPTVNAYTAVSNVLVGSGNAQSPWRIITTLQLGGTGLQLIRSVRYTNGDLFVREDFEVRNNSSRTANISLFHAADLQTAGDPAGYGYYDSVNGGIGGYNSTRNFFQLFVPIFGGSRYQEGLWNTIWAAIGNTSGPGPGFDNSYHPDTYEDNGAGLQWSISLAPGARINFADFQSFTTSLGCTVNFYDVFPSDYYYDPVNYMACTNILSGYGDNTFRPGNNTTRSQLTKIIVNAEGWTIDTTGGPHFRDVPADNAFYNYVETAYNHQVISGYACGGPGEPCPGYYFRPGASVTRSQLVKIIVSARGWTQTCPGTATFRDVPVGNTFFCAVETAYAHGIISGYSCGSGCLEFRPGYSATRGQIAKIVYNAITAP